MGKKSRIRETFTNNKRNEEINMFNKDKRFDISLAEGEIKEQELADILTNKKIEVKYDKLFQKTGNIAIEFQSRGKPSGICTTEADYWAFILEGTGVIMLIDRFVLEDKIKRVERKNVKGGDDLTSDITLIKGIDLLYPQK